MTAPARDVDLGRLHLSDDEDAKGLFDSPVARSTTPRDPIPHKHAAQTSSAAREQSLRAELAQLKQMNSTFETLNQSLSTASANLQTMQTNMDSAKTLLKTWSRILSQAEHNQRLILDSRWQGATKDVQDIESEELRRQEEAQRKMQEEQARQEEQQRKREEAARRQEAGEQKKTRGLGRTRSTRGARIGSTPSRGAASSLYRGSGGIARGAAVGQGRGRS